MVTDQKERDKVIKQSFSPDKVPPSLDAVVVGSGIGGLTTAALLARTGKKVFTLVSSSLYRKNFRLNVYSYIDMIHPVGMTRATLLPQVDRV